jgi:hypothetical protein
VQESFILVKRLTHSSTMPKSLFTGRKRLKQ